MNSDENTTISELSMQLPMSLYNPNDEQDKNKILNEMSKMIKLNGNIFLLGYPSNNITMLILKLYHENIVRVSKQNKMKSTTADVFMFMTGLLQLKNSEYVYVTISESEKEGKDYEQKFNMFYSLLINSGCTVENGEGENFPFGEIIKYKNEGDNDFDEDTYNLIKDDVFIDAKNQRMYSSAIKSYPIKVKLIQSIKYVKDREEKGYSFMPFKQFLQSPETTSVIRCIYGSLCVESKLFGHIYNQGYKYTDIVGYVAYWIGKELPPNHYLGKYSYSKQKKSEENKIKDMFKTTMGKLNDKSKELLNTICNNDTSNEYCMNVITNAIQPIALTCPGCYMNWQLYKNNIQNKWDPTVCARYKGGRQCKKTIQLKQAKCKPCKINTRKLKRK